MEQRPRRYDYIGHDRTPESIDLLYLHEYYRATLIWEKEARRKPGEIVDPSINETLRIRRYRFIPGNVQNFRFMQLMFECGFLRCWQMGYLPHVDKFLVTALVERWRPETHTFHMPHGEMSITLQDVLVLLQLPTCGRPITGVQVPRDWGELCVELLGQDPTIAGGSRGNKIKLSWLASQFDASTLTANTPNEVVEQYVRANILLLIGSHLFAEKDDAHVKVCWLPFLRDLSSMKYYSWGGACLAFFYKKLCLATKPDCKDIGGATHLFCMWAWQRFPPTCPIFHMNNEQVPVPSFLTIKWRPELKITRSISSMSEMRRLLKELEFEDINWRPFDGVDEISTLLSQESRDQFRARVPLICFNDVEWHYPDRVLRQLGLAQDIPKPPEPQDGIHASDFRGPSDRNWAELYKGHVKAYNEWQKHIVHGARGHYDIHYHDAYMDWYRRVTIRFLTIRGAAQPILSDAVELMWRESQGQQLHSDELRRAAESALGAAGEQRRYHDFPASQEVHSAHFNTEYEIGQEEKEPRGRRRRTLLTGRRKVESLPHVPCIPVRPPLQWNDYMSFHNPNMAGSSSGAHFAPYDMGRTTPHENVYRPTMDVSPKVPNFQDFGGQSRSSFGNWMEALTYPSSHQGEMVQNDDLGGEQSIEARDTDEENDNGEGEGEGEGEGDCDDDSNGDGTETPLPRRGSRERNPPNKFTTSGKLMYWKKNQNTRRKQ